MFADIESIVQSMVRHMQGYDLKSVEYTKHVDIGTQKDGLETEVLCDDGISEAITTNGIITTIAPALDSSISSDLIALAEYLIPNTGALAEFSVKAKIKKGFIKFTAEADGIVNTLKVQFIKNQ